MKVYKYFTDVKLQLFEYNVCLFNPLALRGQKFSDKMDLSVQMRAFHKIKHRHAICWKFEDFISLSKLVLEVKANICSLFLYCCKFSAFAIAVIILHNNKVCLTKKLRLEQKSLTLQQTLKFQNRLLIGAHFILDIKLSWFCMGENACLQSDCRIHKSAIS